jgi:diguanylate cyclase (GGDEF)-like protein
VLSDTEAIALPPGFIRDISRAQNRVAVLQAAAEWLPRILGGERSSVALPHDDEHLAIHAIGGTLVMSRGKPLPIETSLVGQAFRRKEVVVIDDLELTDYGEATSLVAGGLRSAIVAPMVSGGRSLGTLNLGNAERGWFSEGDEQRISAIATLIASFMNVHDLVERERVRAATDDLTGLMARRSILGEVAAAVLGDEERPCLLFMDMDGFKAVNDTHGHQAGDEVLRVVTRRVERLLGPDDRVGRLGGDEFLVMVRDDPTGLRGRALADAIQASCSTPIALESVRIMPRLSIGIAAAETPETSADQLLLDADQALYTAKRTPGGIAQADDEIRKQALLIAIIDRDIDVALDCGSLDYHYQPIRCLETGRVLGAEALLRWRHPVCGPVPPPLLVERVEATGRVSAFTEWSLSRVASDLAYIRSLLPQTGELTFSVNLSRNQLAWDGCAASFLDACRAHGLQTTDLVAEVVESSEIQTGDAAEATLRQLAELGAAIALDDFGTGHNALGYFTRFPIHAIKFDRSLVRAMATDHKARQILRSLASMSRELGIVTLAEGVETDEEYGLAVAAGISHGQGWHFGRPMPLAELISLAESELAVDVAPAAVTCCD